MAPAYSQKPLTAWILGLVIVAGIEAFLVHTFFGTACNAPALAQVVVLVLLPAVYLVLMYLTLMREA